MLVKQHCVSIGEGGKPRIHSHAGDDALWVGNVRLIARQVLLVDVGHELAGLFEKVRLHLGGAWAWTSPGILAIRDGMVRLVLLVVCSYMRSTFADGAWCTGLSERGLMVSLVVAW